MGRLWTAFSLILLLASLPACSLRLERGLEGSRTSGAAFASSPRLGDTVLRETPEGSARQEPAAAQREEWWGDTLPVAPIQ
jgi:hypothetical protein